MLKRSALSFPRYASEYKLRELDKKSTLGIKIRQLKGG